MPAGEDPAKIEALLKDDPEVLPMWREAMHEHGGDRRSEEIKHNNVMLGPVKQGNSRSYKLDRLKRHDAEHGTDWFQQVINGDLSAHRACIQAWHIIAAMKIRPLLPDFGTESAMADSVWTERSIRPLTHSDFKLSDVKRIGRKIATRVRRGERPNLMMFFGT